MRFKFTIFLILANLATFGLILHESGKGSRALQAELPIFSTGVSKISVASAAAGELFSLEMRGKEWFLTKPFVWQANPFAVNSVLNELRFLGSEDGFRIEDAQSMGNTLANYGLEVPSVVVTVKDDVGERTLKIGKTTADGSNVYVLSPDGKRIVPAPKSLLLSLSKPPEAFRVAEVFSMRPYEVQTISVRSNFKGGNEQRVGLVRARRESKVPGKDAEHIWRFETPIAADAETALVEKNLSELTALAYTRFLGSDLALFDQSGLKSPQMRFALESAQKNQALLIGNPDPSDKTGKTLFAKLENNDAIFTVPTEKLQIWRDAARELRDPYFFTFEPALLSAITVIEGDHALVFHRTEMGKFTEKSAADERSGVAESPAQNVPAETEPFVGAVALPLQENRAAGALYNFWQMPVAPGSRVTSATNVAPEVLQSFVEKLLKLKAECYPQSAGEKKSIEHRRHCEAFVTDNATAEDIAEMHFDKPLRLVELQFRDPKTPSAAPQVMTLSIAPAVDKNSPIHAKVGTAIYSISNAILDELSTDPTFFRDRSIYRVPAGGQIVSVKLVDVAGTQEKTLYNEKKPDDVNDWIGTLVAKNEPFPRALADLIKCMQNLVADGFLPDKFSRDFRFDYLDAGAPETWRYRLEIGVKLAGGDVASTPETQIYYLTKRLGGTFQLAASPAQNCIFKMNRDFIDAMHALTFSIDASKDVPEIPLPANIKN